MIFLFPSPSPSPSSSPFTLSNFTERNAEDGQVRPAGSINSARFSGGSVTRAAAEKKNRLKVISIADDDGISSCHSLNVFFFLPTLCYFNCVLYR